MKHVSITTAWEGPALLVQRGAEVLDAIRAEAIRRVILVCDRGDTPSDLQYALVDTGADHLLLPAACGIAGPVYFERQTWWTARSCLWWVTRPHAPLPASPCPGLWLLRPERPPCLRLPAQVLAPLIDGWPLEGPQTWEQRRWTRATQAQKKTRP